MNVLCVWRFGRGIASPLHGTMLCLMLLLIAACGPLVPDPEGQARDQFMMIYAASSLTDAFEELGAAFQRRTPGLSISYNFAGSSTLALQLEEGARADVFASANEAQMTRVIEAGRIVGTPTPFAANSLTVAVPASNPAKITTMTDLAAEDVRVVVASEGVPVRAYTETVFENLLRDGPLSEADLATIRANVVSEEGNVRGITAKLALGTADAGFVYATDVRGADLRTLDIIPPQANITAEYPIGVVAGGEAGLAAAFIAFVRSPDGQAILAEHGFQPTS